MESEVFDAFRAIGVPDDKASAAAQALNRRDPEIAPLKGDVAAIKTDIASMKLDLAVLKWGVGLIVGGVISLMFFAPWLDGSRHGGGLHSSPPYKGGLGQILKQKSGAHDRHRELVFRGGNMKSEDLTRSV